MRLEGGAAVLAVGCCVCWLVAVTQVTGAAEVASGGVAGLPTGSLMLRPQRPSQFRHEGEVKAYLQRLRDWVEDSMRNNARFGKRGYEMSSRSAGKGQPRKLTQWNDYDYYTQFNA